jgi:ubiquinone/menaquinone biosynthesis C-methylase UbiE
VATKKDCWAEWLAERRFGGDPDVRERFAATLLQKRDRVLDGAQAIGSDALLDVGCGEGLVGFGALERGAGTVTFVDISQDLLDFCEAAAQDLGVDDRCRFVRASADDLSGVEGVSVDAVTTRAVLIYVPDKAAAFGEFARVLRPGGRISLLEPINRFARTEADTWAGYDLSAIPDISKKIRAVYDELQPPDTDPMLDFDERDLIALAERAGFFPIRLTLEAEVTPVEPRVWSGFLDQAGNPRLPTIGEVIANTLSPGERDRFEAHVRPLVEEGRGEWRMAEAHLVAVKP